MSDELEKLAEIAAREADGDRAARSRRGRAAQSEADRAKRRRKKQHASEARAPIGFFRSMRGFGMIMVTGLIGVSVLALQLHDATLPWASIGIAAAAWAVIVGALLIDNLTWRRRLPFRLEGYEHIAARAPDGDDVAPWVRVSVALHLADGVDAAAAAPHAARVLDILASRINKKMASDRDRDFDKDQRWKVADGAAEGESTYAFYTQRLCERWLRREVRLLARAFPLERVVVRAAYTGRGYDIPSSD